MKLAGALTSYQSFLENGSTLQKEHKLLKIQFQSMKQDLKNVCPSCAFKIPKMGSGGMVPRKFSKLGPSDCLKMSFMSQNSDFLRFPRTVDSLSRHYKRYYEGIRQSLKSRDNMKLQILS